jgi:hypothetical protein
MPHSHCPFAPLACAADFSNADLDPKSQRGATSMDKKTAENQGEGNPQAAEHFNAAEQRFVNSESGRQKIREGAMVRPEEEAGLAEAERIGREHAKSAASAGTKQK